MTGPLNGRKTTPSTEISLAHDNANGRGSPKRLDAVAQQKSGGLCSREGREISMRPLEVEGCTATVTVSGCPSSSFTCGMPSRLAQRQISKLKYWGRYQESLSEPPQLGHLAGSNMTGEHGSTDAQTRSTCLSQEHGVFTMWQPHHPRPAVEPAGKREKDR